MRCYNGCPDTELQKLLDDLAATENAVRKIQPEAHCTFHTTDGYVIHVWGKEISDYHPTLLAAWQDALRRMKP